MRLLKKFPARLDEVAREKAVDVGKIEIWFQDEARIGQKNKITHGWAKRGTRPSAPRDQRTASTYTFGAICPKQGKGAALILPFCNTEAMNLHLAEIAKAVAPAAHAVLFVDQAGWHLLAGLFIPANITIIPLPPIEPRLQILRRYRRSLLLRLEYAPRPPLENHVHRAASMGARVLINETRYKSARA